jgi:deoxyhypusine synthase
MAGSATGNLPPAEATDAVLVPSAALPEGAQKVEEIDFNDFKGRPITVDDLTQRMQHMGFQASSMGEAIRIINEMVSKIQHLPDKKIRTDTICSGHGEMQRRGTEPPFSSVIRPT